MSSFLRNQERHSDRSYRAQLKEEQAKVRAAEQAQASAQKAMMDRATMAALQAWPDALEASFFLGTFFGRLPKTEDQATTFEQSMAVWRGLAAEGILPERMGKVMQKFQEEIEARLEALKQAEADRARVNSEDLVVGVDPAAPGSDQTVVVYKGRPTGYPGV